MKNLTQAIDTVANQMNGHINSDILTADLMGPKWFNDMLEVVIESNGYSFENSTAEAFFNKAVRKAMSPAAYQVVFPLLQMDENGAYTSDSSKWA